jgi:dTDP-4-amino-4,6-dideoxygalactose transaminase
MNEEISLFKVFMSNDVKDKVEDVLSSGYIGQGEKVEEFESALVNYIGRDYISTTNSATSALHLALHLLKSPFNKVEYGALMYKTWSGLSDGDEVLCTPLTCTATNFPVLANNLNIKWVDVDPNTMNMDLDDLERKITSKTKVILLVHWGGYPVDLDRVKEIQKKTKVKFGFKPAVIEDCAHAMGSTYKGKRLGNHGNICVYSFQAIKHITSGDGGMLIVPHMELYQRAKLLRWYGIDRENNKKDFRCEADISEWGFKFHMNDINAAIGLENLKEATKIIGRHKDNGKYYDQELSDVSGVRLLERMPDRDSAFWVYSMLVDKKDDFMNWMKECGIIVSQVHERNDIHSCLSEFNSHLPNLDKVVPQLISIPVGWWVTDEQRKYIVDCIKRGW